MSRATWITVVLETIVALSWVVLVVWGRGRPVLLAGAALVGSGLVHLALF